MKFEAALLDPQSNLLLATAGARQTGILEKIVNLPKGRDTNLEIISHSGDEYAVLLIPTDEFTILLISKGPPDTLVDFVTSVDFSFNILEHFLTNPYEGITVVDSEGILRYISPVHERFFGMKRGASIGRRVREIIENTRLDVVAETGVPEIGQVQEMRGVSRVVNRVPIRRDGEIVGAIGQVMFKTPEQLHALSRQVSSLRAEVDHYRKELVELQQKTFGLNEIIGESAIMRRLKDQIRKVSDFDIPVFISGESGTGKELIAQAIHTLSSRSDQSMVIVNCGSLPDTLVESELFGYEPGAFTGARKEGRVGKFELANKSSLFLDEMGEMPMATQVKLLRVLENGTFERLGGNRQCKTNFRLITATNRDLRQRIAQEEFRSDLFFRINGVTLYAPPLRERLEDIPLLAKHFLQRLSSRLGLKVRSISPEALAFLMTQSWPGNVRQLQNTLQRALVFSEGEELTLADFQETDRSALDVPVFPVNDEITETSKIKDKIDKVEIVLIREAMDRHNGNKKRVAEELGISRSYLYKKLNDSEYI